MGFFLCRIFSLLISLLILGSMRSNTSFKNRSVLHFFHICLKLRDWNIVGPGCEMYPLILCLPVSFICKLSCYKHIRLIYWIFNQFSYYPFIQSHSTKAGKQPPTEEAPVVSWGKRVSNHHHGGVNNDLLTLPRRGGDLSSPSTSVQPQCELSAVPIQLHLVPLSITEVMVGECQVVVSIAKVVENSQQTLNNLTCTVELCWFKMQAFKQRREPKKQEKNKDVWSVKTLLLD